jgi:hypothetical protein
MNDDALPVVLVLCVGVLLCLLFPSVGQALGAGARFIVAEGAYTSIAIIIAVLIAFEWLFLIFLKQVLCLRSGHAERAGGRVSATVLLASCGAIGTLGLVATFLWAVSKPVGPYW